MSLLLPLELLELKKDLPLETKEIILQIQRELFIVGAEIATSKENRNKLDKLVKHLVRRNYDYKS